SAARGALGHINIGAVYPRPDDFLTFVNSTRKTYRAAFSDLTDSATIRSMMARSYNRAAISLEDVRLLAASGSSSTFLKSEVPGPYSTDPVYALASTGDISHVDAIDIQDTAAPSLAGKLAMFSLWLRTADGVTLEISQDGSVSPSSSGVWRYYQICI